MTSIMQLVLFTLGLLLFGFGLFVGVYPQGDQTVGILMMFGGLAQIVYSIGVNHEWKRKTTNGKFGRKNKYSI